MSFVSAKNNPFTVDRLHAVKFRFSAGDWQSHLATLQELNFRASVVGRQGSGKSTLLRELHGQLKALGIDATYENLTRDRTQHALLIRELTANNLNGQVLIVDGIERLGFWGRQRLLRNTKQGPGLIVSNHIRGVLPVWIRTTTSKELLFDILQDLNMGQFEIKREAESLFKTHRGNIRSVLRCLYDEIASGQIPCASPDK